MGTPTPDALRGYFASKYLASDGGTITQQTADAGGSATTIVDAALTQADDYWNGAVGWFDGATTTTALQGQFFHVRDFDAATDTLTLAQSLPAAPAAGDAYYLVLGGNYRGNIELFGLTLDGDQPEEVSVTGTNVTGLTITKAAATLDLGTLSVFYDQSADELFIKVGADAYGVALDVSSDVSAGIVYDDTGNGWIQVNVTNASLPGSDQTDTFALAKPKRTFVPDFEGYETGSTGGHSRYRLEVVKNTDGADTMVDLSAWLETPSGTDTTVAAGESLGTGEGSFAATDAGDWPTQGFWVRNTTANAGAGDCRYVKYRSGNTLYCLAVDWGTLAFDAGSTEIVAGDTITDATSGATAIVDQIVVSSGTWGGSDAAGTMILKDVSGTFGDNNNIQVSAATCAVADGASALGYRGYAATTWSAADAIEVMPDVDIGLDAPSSSQFESPASIYTAPSGVSFSSPGSEEDALLIGDLAAGGLYGVWRREVILDQARARNDLDVSVNYTWI